METARFIYNKANLLLVICLVSMQGCRKKQPDLAPYNKGCDCAHTANADFTIEEMDGQGQSWTKYTETDTIYFNKNVRFTALETDAAYTWYIGSEKLNDKTVDRYFGENLKGQTIPISLVVKNKPNTICFPTDDGYDSLVKHFVVSKNVIGVDSSYQLEGTFRMKEKNQSDSVDITIDLRRSFQNDLLVDIYNYDGKGSNSIAQYNGYGGISYNYRQLWFSLSAHQAILHHPIAKKIQLQIIGNGSTYPSYYYSGRKL